MEKYLDTIYSLLILDIPLTNPFNSDVYQSYQNNPSKFWMLLRHQANTVLENPTSTD